MVERFLRSGRSGFYFSVLKEGHVAVGDAIDLVSADLPDLLRQLDGRTITRFDGTTTVLHTADVEVVRVGTRLISIGLELVHTPYVAEGSPHLLYGFHVFERRLERFSGRLHGIHRSVTRSVGCGSRLLAGGPCRFSGFPQTLPFFTKQVERLTIEVAHLPRFFCKPSELLGLLTSILSPLACAFRLLAVLFRRKTIVRCLCHCEGNLPCRIGPCGRGCRLSYPTANTTSSTSNQFSDRDWSKRVA